MGTELGSATAGRLNGRKALVTGAGTGIGREIALEFARQGADVVLHFHPHSEGVTSAVREMEEMGRRALAIHARFESIDETLAMAKQACEFLGGIDCLVNNAGITFDKPFSTITPQQFDRLFQVNVRAQFFLTQFLVEKMLPDSYGTVCNIASIHGLQGAPGYTLYAATKGAIVSYTRALAVELAHKGVRVNSIAPGWILVESHLKAIQGYKKEDALARAKDKVPASRYGSASDVAKVAVVLCSNDAQFIIGQTIVVDGGTTALMSLLSDFRAELPSRFGKEYMADLL